MVASDGALDVVPPVAGEEFLAEDGAVWAEERVLSSTHVAHVKHLLKKKENLMSTCFPYTHELNTSETEKENERKRLECSGRKSLSSFFNDPVRMTGQQMLVRR